MNDRYLLNFPDQPKKQVGDDLEELKLGISVAPRYANFEEGLSSGEVLIARSEHPFEYNGHSGILESEVINPAEVKVIRQAFQKDPESAEKKYGKRGVLFSKIGEISQEEFEKGLIELSSEIIKQYCRILELNEEEFKSKISYSYWKKLDGNNRSIVADTSIQGRYHIFTEVSAKTHKTNNYIIWDNGKVIQKSEKNPPAGFEKRFTEDIDFYEKIRRSGLFDPAHCGLVEFQTAPDGANYFLQYHRTRDEETAGFELDKETIKAYKEKGYLEADFIRGATTDKNGLEYDVVMHYKPSLGNIASECIREEQGAFTGKDVEKELFSEIMSRRRSLAILLGRLTNADSGHLLRSNLFKPAISVIAPYQKNPEWENTSIKMTTDLADGADCSQPRKIHIISDGRRAVLRLFDKSAENPNT